MNVQLTTSAATEKKQAIFESTLKLIREFGFHGTPVSQIAQHAGVATGTIYHYFASKDELIIALFRYSKQKIHDATFRDHNPNDTYRDRFVSIWINLVNYYSRFPEVLSFFEQFYSSPFVREIFTDETMCFQDEVSLFLKEGINSGHIKQLDINIISAAFLGTVIATAKRSNNPMFRFNEEDLRNMVGIIWDGIKK
ncbi:TetR/AcrR family transcriptional regulator [Chitinophaga sp. XS-30]|uniref:TetR/AcrR family transcriptional regulator n=1 Tax=Chitinophaga sp. XS-30 TaxID=2604421 RepID=UPI0011DCBBE8|nr:TetR/AcrR family transcriptional regulator [Chitinophaga sp. XS-30]QEH42508.1 TetR/AcrR family transcriptional regulator [Chitinophaga sp. XS-30]